MPTAPTPSNHPDHDEQAMSDLERQVEDAAPGVLEALELYQRATPPAIPWRALNTGAIRYANGTADSLR